VVQSVIFRQVWAWPGQPANGRDQWIVFRRDVQRFDPDGGTFGKSHIRRENHHPVLDFAGHTHGRSIRRIRPALKRLIYRREIAPFGPVTRATREEE